MLHTTTVGSLLVVGVLVFVAGMAFGWLAAVRDDNIENSRLKTGIAIAITIIWVTTILAEILIPAYTVSVLVHGIMGGLVGYLFSSDEGFTINIGGNE